MRDKAKTSDQISFVLNGKPVKPKDDLAEKFRQELEKRKKRQEEDND